ncbi:hypothetical protein [Caproiciproducens sp.]
MKDNKHVICESDNIKNFKYIINDDEISCVEDEDIDSENIKAFDIIESLSESEKYWFDKSRKLNADIKEITKLAKQAITISRWSILQSNFNYIHLANQYNQFVRQIENDECDFNEELNNKDNDLEIHF